MCIAFWTLDHPEYALILAANRDEFLHRATVNAHWHAFEPISTTSPAPGSSQARVLAGRDIVAGGTWLGINRSGHIAVLTNIREDFASWPHSRGDLASAFLLDESTPLQEYAAKLADASQPYAGFNLLLFAPSSVAAGNGVGPLSMNAELVTNHGGGGKVSHRPLTQDEITCAGISNGVDGSPCWTKVLDGTEKLEALLSRASNTDSRVGQESLLVNGLLDILSNEAPTSITDRSHLRNTIQVPLITLSAVPTLIGTANQASSIPAEKQAKMYYATRLASVILVRRDTGEVVFLERDVYQLPKDGEESKVDGPTNVSRGRHWKDGDDAAGHDRVFRFTIQQSTA